MATKLSVHVPQKGAVTFGQNVQATDLHIPQIGAVQDPTVAAAAAGRIMSSLAASGGLAGAGGIAGQGGGLAG